MKHGKKNLVRKDKDRFGTHGKRDAFGLNKKLPKGRLDRRGRR